MQGLQAAVHVHGLADLALLASLGSPAGRACAALAFSPDGRRLAAAEAAPGRHITVYSWREARALAGPSPLTSPAHVLCPHGKVHITASWELQHKLAVWLRDIMHALPPCTRLWLLSAQYVYDVICCETPSDQSKLGTSITGYSSAPGAQKSRVGSTGWPEGQCQAFLFHCSPPHKVCMQGAVEAEAPGPWPAAQLSFCPLDGGRLAATGSGALALWRLHTLLGAPELCASVVATPGGVPPATTCVGDLVRAGV